MKNIVSIIILILTSIILIECASEAQLTGGAKDTLPPVIVYSKPKNKSTHFDATKISIRMDEFIKLNNLQSELVLSPPIKPKPEIVVRGKNLEISLNDAPLLPNTTYTIFLGKAIADIHENNAIPNFKYTFSTGDFVDSLSLKGKVKDALELTPEEEALVMLYRKGQNDTLALDSLPLLSMPLYLSRTDKEGAFKIENIAQGKYLIFALKDDNRNYRYDLPSEKIAFIDTLISLNYPLNDSAKINIPYLELFMFQEIDSTQRLLSAKLIKENYLAVAYKNPLIKPKVNLLTKNSYFKWNNNNDSLFVWFPPVKKDSISILISDNKDIHDTLNIRVVARKNQQNVKLNITSNVKKNSLSPHDQLNLFFNYPIKSLNTDKIKILEDSIPVPFVAQFVDSNKMQLLLDYEMKEEQKYRIVIPDSTLIDIRNHNNDSTEIVCSRNSTDKYGTLTVKLNTKDTIRKIIQLLDSKGVSIRNTIVKDSLVSFELLAPAEYQLKCIYDANRNGVWDAGNYIQHIQAEEVKLYDKKIKVRASWELQKTWQLEKIK